MSSDAPSPLNEHLDRFTRFVNEGTDLRLALNALSLRYAETGGLTEMEQQNLPLGRSVEWAAKKGAERVGTLAAVGILTAVEVYVEDVFVEVCSHVDLPTEPRIRKVKVPLAEFTKSDEPERFRILWNRIESPERDGVDKWDDILKLVGVSVNVETLSAIGLLPESPTRNNGLVRRILRELYEVRNVILHRGGIVDRKLVEASRGGFGVGEPLRLANQHLDDYGHAAIEHRPAARHMVWEVSALRLSN